MELKDCQIGMIVKILETEDIGWIKDLDYDEEGIILVVRVPGLNDMYIHPSIKSRQAY